MAALNTQLGYKTPKPPGARPTGVRATGGAPKVSSGVTRALASVAPAAQSFRSPYADPTQTLFPEPAQQQVQSTAPPGTPSQYTPQPAVAPQSPAGFSFDLETDPILQQMHATAAKQRADAEAGALAQRKTLAIQYGHQAGTPVDPSMYPDQATAAAAEGNPFSVTANLANEYQTGTRNLENQLNTSNLFYSGARINELANALRDYQQQQAGAASAYQGNLGSIDQNRIASLMGADQSEQQAYQDAYSRALQFALANQTAPPVPGGGGAPVGGDPLAGAAVGGDPLAGIAGAARTAPGAAGYNGYDAPIGGAGGIDPGFNVAPNQTGASGAGGLQGMTSSPSYLAALLAAARSPRLPIGI